MSREHPRLHKEALRQIGDNPAVVGFLRWDVWWYVSILERGYWFDPERDSNVAFLPGFPALMRLANPLFSRPVYAGLFVANACFLAAVIVFFKWVRERAGAKAAERAALFLLVYPWSFFCNTVYSEAPFILWCTLALREADRERWSHAGVYACFATLTRPLGLFLVLGFAWSIGRSWRAGTRPGRTAYGVLVPVLGLGAYAVYLWVRMGTPFAVLIAQRAGWNVGETFQLFRFPEHRSLIMELMELIQNALPFLLLAACVPVWRRLGSTSGVYTVVTTLVVLGFGMGSFGRETLSLVPMFAVIGLLPISGPALAGIYLSSFALLLAFTYQFSLGSFLG